MLESIEDAFWICQEDKLSEYFLLSSRKHREYCIFGVFEERSRICIDNFDS